MKMWYTSAVEKKVTIDARKLGGFDRDILGWNIPEEELAVHQACPDLCAG